ncbi:MAG: YXWGXW repeat-containing protein [Gammaproteobacteria bacterium]
MQRITTGLMLAAVLALPATMLPASSASAGVSAGISVGFAPPPLPYYQQPILPAPGYIWVPGYWAYGPYGYYWVPGAWVLPPAVGLLWTPGYWGWGGGYYRWHAGYWGLRVGFYGGINYGYGYPGRGYNGGYWNRGHFYYNRAVVNVNIRNVYYVYNKPVAYKNRGRRVSYNGGKGGTTLRPTKQQLTWARERRAGQTTAQMRYRDAALKAPAMRYKNNQGKPFYARLATRPTALGKLQSRVPRPEPAIGAARRVSDPMARAAAAYNRRMPSQRIQRLKQPSVRINQAYAYRPRLPSRVANPPRMRVKPSPAWRQVRRSPQNAYRAAFNARRPGKPKGNKHPPQ